MNKEIGKKLRSLRGKMILSQKELAQKAGVSQNTICRIEKSYHVPNYATLEKIAQVVGSEFLLSMKEVNN